MPHPSPELKAKLTWKQRAKQFKSEIYALYFACRDPRVPWHVKAFIAFVVGYAFSPIDLIPDFIPVLGYLDDLLLVPLLAALAVRMIPAQVMTEAREQARTLQSKPKSWVGAVVIIAIWLSLAFWGANALLGLIR